QSALTQMHCLDVALSLILIDVEAEERADLQRTLGERDVHDVVRCLDRVDARQLGVERMNTLLLDPRGIHRRRPEVADLLRVASGCGLRRRRMLVDLT